VKTYLTALIAVVALAATGLASAAAPARTDWQEGVHYFRLENMPRAGSAPGKVDVVEVFSYGCPACNEFAPMVRKLRAGLPAAVNFSYVPAAFNAAEDWPMFQRAYLTAVVLGVADKAHDAMFDAVWKTHELAIMDEGKGTLKSPQPTIEDAAKFYSAKTGVKAADFVAAANSMSIGVKINDANSYIRLYRVNSTPTMIINNKYRLDARTAGGYPQLIELVNFLVAKEVAALPKAAAPVAAPAAKK
jgi:thiol:disulfide interchange protein DsbA